MTEAEMKKTWCPHVRLMTANGRDGGGSPNCPQPQTTFNRIGINGEEAPYIDARCCCCLGSGCSQWRWSDVPPPAGPAWKPTEGFCGLAGRP